MKLKHVAWSLGFTLILGCVPDVYLIDRQTVLETQASGSWPELDRIFYEETISSGPLPLEETSSRREGRQIYQMTHSDSKQEKREEL